MSIALNDSEYEYAGDNTVLFRGETLEVQLNTSDGRPVVCVDFTQNGTKSLLRRMSIYPPGYEIITFSGCGLSLIGCFIVLLTFSLFKELRTLPSKLLMNITLTILVISFVTMLTASKIVGNSAVCQVVAIIDHFFILSQFMWMSVMCAEVAHTFYLSTRLIPPSPKHSSRKLLTYTVLSWGVPCVVVIISVILNYSTSNLIGYGKIDSRSCWINHLPSAIVAYLVPVAISTIAQCILFIFVGIFLFLSSKRKSAEASGQKKSTPYCRVVFALFFATNIVWVLGFMAVLVRAEWSWYPFVILQSFQGFIIFIGFVCTKKVLNLYLTLFSSKFFHFLT